jgi:hypothetical protein
MDQFAGLIGDYGYCWTSNPSNNIMGGTKIYSNSVFDTHLNIGHILHY